MLAQQLRQRGLSAAQSPCAISGQAWWNQPVVLMATSADGKLPTGNPSAPATSAKSPPKPASSAGTNSSQNSGSGLPRTPETMPPSQQPPSPTLAAMSQLKAKLASSGLSTGRKDTTGSQPPHQDKSKPPAVAPREPAAPSTVPKPSAQLQAASFQGVPLQLGEEGNALQSMAVLTHGNVRQLEEYSKDLLAGDQRFLASLQRMGEVPQQRAAAIMQMALGAVPPPALLVWAAKEVTGQVQALLRTALRIPEPVVPPQAADGTAVRGAGETATPAAAGATAAASEVVAAAGGGDAARPEVARAAAAVQQPPGGEGITQTGAGAGGGGLHVEAVAVAAEDLERLRAQPWFEGALQLARLVLSGPQPHPPATTELQLLRTFANLPAQRGTPTVLPWEALLTLPQLPAVLDAAAEARPALASTLELAGLRPAAADASSTAAAAQWLLPQLRVAAATARSRALAATGWATAAEDAPLDADVRLTAVARGEATAEAEARTAAAEWLAAACLLRRAAEQLGCAGVVSGVRQEAVAVLQVLGLPLEPPELPYMDELKVPNDELQHWIADQAKQITAGNVNAAPPAGLESRLTTVRHRLAAAGRALALLDPSPAAESGSSRGSTTVAATATAGGPETSTSTGAWLRAVGTPLASALLAGGYNSLSKLRGMVPELREALVLRLLESGRTGAGTAALTAAMYGDAVAAWRVAHADNNDADNATTCLRTDAVRAELDVVHERFIAPVAAVPPRRPLPSESELTEAVAALPGPERQLYNSYYALHVDGTAGAAARPDPAAEGLRLAEALAAGSGAEEGLRQLAAAGDLQAWLADARKAVLTLPPPLLALLLRFMRVQVSITPEAAQAQRNKLTALMLLLAQQQHKAVADRPTRGGGAAAVGTAAPDDRSMGADAAAADAAARELVEFFSRGSGVEEDVAAALGVAVDEGEGGGGKGRMPRMLSRLLGSGAAKEFGYWLQAHVHNAPSGQSTHDMLGLQHTEMDVQRYLTMTQDPRLHLPRSGALSSSAAPTRAAWTDPDLRVSEAEWLQRMRPQLDAYLAAMGYRTLGEAEWGVYRDAALTEWEAGREVREEQLEAAGASGFLNPRADEVYLQQLLERSIPQDAPLGPQSRRYLDTLLRNPTWTFADRRRAVMRLIQLNNYFARQPTAPTDGSPFASLFAVGGPDAVPRLGPLEGAPERGRLAMGARSGAGTQPLPLPEGF